MTIVWLALLALGLLWLAVLVLPAAAAVAIVLLPRWISRRRMQRQLAEALGRPRRRVRI